MLVNSSVFDHTNNNSGGAEADGYATRLTGATGNKQYGLARSLSVMPGDTVKVGVYAKYIQRDGSGNWPAAVAGLMSAITSNAAGVVVDGGLEGSLGNGTFPFAGFIDKSNETGTVPKAYLNYIVFDRDYAMLDFGYLRTSVAANEDGTNRPHEHLFKDDIIVNKPGYVYIYLSNENETSVEVFFDDFRVEHVKGPVVQMDDYYPFGLTFNSYKRENSVENKIKFQGQEHIDDLNLGWVQFKWRNHDPSIGRFFNVDPLSEKFYYNSPYAFSENKVTNHIELEGLEALEIHLIQKVAEFKARTSGSVSNIKNGGGRLVTGNSGSVPSSVPMSDGDRQMVKLGGKVSDAKMVTDGVKDITKTGIKMGAQEGQAFGDAIETAGVLTAQPEIAAVGAVIADVSTGIEMAVDASNGELSTETAAFEVGKKVVFGPMSSGTKKAVEAGNLDKKAGDIFQGMVNAWDRFSDWVKSTIDDNKK